jgi:hypothetical protein
MRPGLTSHELAEERSLAIHRVVAERLRQDPRLVSMARARVEGWLKDGSVHPTYAGAWHRLLGGPLDALLLVLSSPAEDARALRQCSPFAGIVDPRTRWRIWSEVRDGLAP